MDIRWKLRNKDHVRLVRLVQTNLLSHQNRQKIDAIHAHVRGNSKARRAIDADYMSPTADLQTLTHSCSDH